VSDTAARNIALYPWFRFFQNLLFWQATWFLYFQSELSAAEALMLYAVYDIATTLLEVPSGWLSDRWGRKKTLVLSSLFGLVSCLLFVLGGHFWMFVLAQAMMGAHIAFNSGTDSSFLYESLEEAGRTDEVEAQELRAWRFGFVALALSAVTGGAMAFLDLRLPFLASAAAFVVVFVVAFRFGEPAEKLDERELTSGERLAALLAALRQPVLVWLFALSVLMYGFSHLPFVFGQPFILSALSDLGLAAEAPLISGAVTACMMLLSVATSWVAPRIRARIGFAGILLVAFGMQIFLVGGLAASGSVFAIALLLLRMVPDSFSGPFIRARIQPELQDEVRATYLSLKSLAGRVLFAASLIFASSGASPVGEMSHDEIRAILAVYAGVGLLAFLALLAAARGRGV
jgi:MFS family permease